MVRTGRLFKGLRRNKGQGCRGLGGDTIAMMMGRHELAVTRAWPVWSQSLVELPPRVPFPPDFTFVFSHSLAQKPYAW